MEDPQKKTGELLIVIGLHEESGRYRWAHTTPTVQEWENESDEYLFRMYFLPAIRAIKNS